MKKYILILSCIIFPGIFELTQAVEYENFPEIGCESVQVVSLQAEKSNIQGFLEYAFFEVHKPDDLVDEWFFSKEEKNRAAQQDLNGNTFKLLPEPVKGSKTIQRFKFGTGKYKKYCVEFQESVPVGPQGENAKSIGADSGIDLIKQYVSMLYKFGSMFIGLVCVLVIVISGVQMTTGGIDPNAYENAKTRILSSLASLILLFGSAMILRTINPGFFT